ncbi:hypothetical protein Y032_0538g3126, partial [Ancylostoma ceylanicum]
YSHCIGNAATEQRPIDDVLDNNSYDQIDSDRVDDITSSTQISRHDKILYYASYIHHFGISSEEVSMMEDLMTVLYGFPPPITYHTDINSLQQSLLKTFEITKHYFCGMCKQKLDGPLEKCQRKGCPLQRRRIKRTKRSDRVEVQVMNVRPQVEDIICENLASIVRFHQRLHNSEVMIVEGIIR